MNIKHLSSLRVEYKVYLILKKVKTNNIRKLKSFSLSKSLLALNDNFKKLSIVSKLYFLYILFLVKKKLLKIFRNN